MRAPKIAAALTVAFGLATAACDYGQAHSNQGAGTPIASTPVASGPFAVHMDYCGKLSAAQQQAYDTQSASGALYTVTNTSQGVTGTPEIEANLTNGSQVVGSAKTTFAAKPIAPGQNEKTAAEPLEEDVPFTGCQTLNYYVNDVSGATEGPFIVQ